MNEWNLGGLRCARPTLLALVLLAAPASAHAERYRVDLIVFGDRTGAGEEAPLPVAAPDLAHALEPYETNQLRNAGIEILPDEQFGLMQHWAHLRNSRNHQPLMRLAWLQKDPPAERGVSIHLHAGAPQAVMTPTGSASVYPVDGSVALLVGRYLHLDAEFVYTQPAASGDLRSYQLKERRRLRRDELHHLDSPRLGVLVRATRAPEKPETKTPAAPAPKKKG